MWLCVPPEGHDRLRDHGYANAGDAKQTRMTHSGDPETWPKCMPEIERLLQIERLSCYARDCDCCCIRLDPNGDVEDDLPNYSR